MKCNHCNSSEFDIVDYKNEFNVKGKNINFIAKRKICHKCKQLIYDSELDNAASLIAINIYNTRYGISKDEITSLRKKYNLSQDLFAKVIGCAKKTLVSYENGKSIPNDAYFKTLKLLIKNPNIIFKIIDANKDSFDVDDYNKIMNRLNKINTEYAIDNYFDFNDPNEYNGYTKLSSKKIINLIILLAKDGILKTKLLKEMFYADFLSYKNTGMSITGLEYAKITYGPVPNDFENILRMLTLKGIIDYEVNYLNNYECYKISSKKSVDMSVFTEKEKEIIYNIKDFFKNYTSSDIANYSHKEKAFINTDNANLISYEYAFDINDLK